MQNIATAATELTAMRSQNQEAKQTKMLHIMQKPQPSQSKILSRLTDESVEIESLKTRIKTLEAKNAVA